MQTKLTPNLLASDFGQEAERILRSCVHCGFCNATCPSYQLLGDELDGPRGRIYLIKQALEHPEAVTDSSLKHLDRCLSCRSCETTCPSGVEYHSLLQIGKSVVEQQVKRPLHQRLIHWGMQSILPYPARFGPLFKLGTLFRPLMPPVLKQKLPASRPAGQRASNRHSRKIILFEGCVQSVVAQSINAATSRILDRLGIEAIRVGGESCCGALHNHMNAIEIGKTIARNNIDAWLPHLEAGAEAIIGTASACGLEISEYAQLLKHDSAYQEKAEQISTRVLDISQFLAREKLEKLIVNQPLPGIHFHAPCTLQHGLKQTGTIENLLQHLGFDLTTPSDAHLCCGSAGVYSVLQPRIATQLRDNKLNQLGADHADIIATANIGCMMHLQSGTQTAVRHWVEILDQAVVD